MTFPVHMIWMQGEKNIPERFSKNLESWREHIDIKVWDGNMIRQLVKKRFPKLLKVYDGYPYFIQRVDLGRYVILYYYGGLYLDIDTNPIKENIKILWERLDKIKNGQIAMPGPNVPYIGLPSMDAKVCNWFMYTAKPKQTFLKKCLDNIHKHTERGMLQLRSYYIVSSVGSVFLTKYMDDTCEIIKVNDVLNNEYAGTWAKLDDHDAVLIAAFVILILIILFIIVLAIRCFRRR